MEQATGSTTKEFGFDSRQEQDSFTHRSRPALGPPSRLCNYYLGMCTRG
jgi:hypothetical protein